MILQALLVLAVIWGMVLLGFTVCAGAYMIWRWRLELLDLKRGQYEAQGATEPPTELTTEAAMHQLMGIAKNQDSILTSAWAQEKHEDGWSDEEIDEFLQHRPEIELN